MEGLKQTPHRFKYMRQQITTQKYTYKYHYRAARLWTKLELTQDLLILQKI